MTLPGAGQIARARAYISAVSVRIPKRRDMAREYLILLGHASALLSAIDAGAIRPGPPTHIEPDGSAWLSPDDTLTMLGALSDGAVWAELMGNREADAASYRRLSLLLGDDR